MVTMEAISAYLKSKYKGDKNIKILTLPIDKWCKTYKQLNPSVNGKRVTEVLTSLSRFVEYVKNRNTIQKLTGTGEKE
jgi:hypothetical protein